jgi:hypothetical protein
MSNPNTMQSSHGKRPPSFTGNIPQSEPFAGVDRWKSNFDVNSHEAPFESQGAQQIPRQPTAQDTEELHTQETETEIENRPRLVCQLAKPRLSPVEYARMYLLEESSASRENWECELPRPDMQWHWTPKYKKFLIIPRIPKNIRRDLVSNTTDSVSNTDGEGSSGGHQVPTLTPEKDYVGLMRLSLHLGKDPVLLPFFPDKSDPKGSDQGILCPQESSKVTEESNPVDVRGRRDTVMPHRGNVHYHHTMRPQFL